VSSLPYNMEAVRSKNALQCVWLRKHVEQQRNCSLHAEKSGTVGCVGEHNIVEVHDGAGADDAH
jgi:hypothetical protein